MTTARTGIKKDIGHCNLYDYGIDNDNDAVTMTTMLAMTLTMMMTIRIRIRDVSIFMSTGEVGELVILWERVGPHFFPNLKGRGGGVTFFPRISKACNISI